MNEASLEANGKTVFILEDFSLESVDNIIVALGHSFQKRKLFSNPLNWIEIEKDLKQLSASDDLLAVLMFLSKRTIFQSLRSEYQEGWHNLLQEMNQNSSLIFVNEDTLLGEFSNVELFSPEWYQYKHEQVIKDELEQTIAKAQKTLAEAQKGISKAQKRFSKAQSRKAKAKQILAKAQNSGEGEARAEQTIADAQRTIDKAQKIIGVGQRYEAQVRENITVANKRKSRAKQIIAKLEERAKMKILLEQVPQAEQLIKDIQRSGVEVVPYKQEVEITLRVQHFLDEIDKGIFLHLYVPNGRYQEDQLASFLRLFESYLQRVEKLQFFIDTRRTLHGQIYEFKSKNTIINSSEMEVAFSRFESFMSLCQNDQKKAEALLLWTGINPSEASRLTTKYVKDYQRLLLDIEHERERKMLDLRQRLESDALELTHDTSLAVPQSVQPTELLALPNNLDLISFNISNSSVIINPGVQSYVEQAIYGDIHYGTEDKELVHLFKRYAEGLEAIRLRSDLEQLKDTSSSEVERKTAKQKIAGFLSKVAPAIGQSALTVLTVYLEKVLTGK